MSTDGYEPGDIAERNGKMCVLMANREWRPKCSVGDCPLRALVNDMCKGHDAQHNNRVSKTNRAGPDSTIMLQGGQKRICNGKCQKLEGTQWRNCCEYGMCLRRVDNNISRCKSHPIDRYPSIEYVVMDHPDDPAQTGHDDTMTDTCESVDESANAGESTDEADMQHVQHDPLIRNNQPPPWAVDKTITDDDGHDRVFGEVYTDSKGIRRAIIARTNHIGNKLVSQPICMGRGGNCTADKKQGDLCKACNSNNPSSRVKRETKGMKEGEIRLCSDGYRHQKRGKQTKILCTANDNKCPNVRVEGGQMRCQAHKNGTTPHMLGVPVGTVLTRPDGTRVRRNARQFVKLCRGDDNTCKITVTKAGMCKRHCEEWICAYDDCENIRVNQTRYCAKHEGGVINARKMWAMEIKVMETLDLMGIRYVHGYTIRPNDDMFASQNRYVYDFYLPDHEILIETDGKQHFSSIKFWGGDDGLAWRQRVDDAKNEIANTTGRHIIRLHYKDAKYTQHFIDRCIELCESAQEPYAFASPSFADERMLSVCCDVIDKIKPDDAPLTLKSSESCSLA